MPEGAFCPASAWIRESRSRQIQLKFEVRFACSPQCSSLLQHVAHGGLHRWHSLRRLHLADCSFALLSAFVLMENSSSYPVLIAEMQHHPHTHTHAQWVSRVCVRVTFVATSVPFPCPLELCLVMSLPPHTDLPKQLCMEKNFPLVL